MAHSLRSSGWDTQFIVPKSAKGKTPDILARNGEREFTIECKSLRFSEADSWINNYKLAFTHELIGATPEGVALFYLPHDEEIDVRLYRDGSRMSPPALAAAVDTFQLVQNIRKMHRPMELPVWRRIPGKGDLALLNESEDFRGAIGVPELSQKHLARQLLDRIRTANDQIKARGIPGIAAVFHAAPAYPGTIHAEFAKLVDNDPGRFRSLMGVLVFPAQNIREYIRPFWVPNERADTCAAGIGVTQSLQEIFLPKWC